MRHGKMLAALLSASMIAGLCACGSSGPPVNDISGVQESEVSMTTLPDEEGTSVEKEAPTEQPEETVVLGNKQVIVYYPNWKLGTVPGDEGGEVGSIAWESVTMINHAFFAPYPDDGTTDSSWDRKDAGLEARTKFKCVSTNPEADFDDQGKSEYNDSPRNHFEQYAIYSKQYPDVRIMLSVGGWSRSGFFSEMCHTAEGRTSFIESCVQLIKDYPFLGGIDIDWEYTAGSMDGQRYPESESDEGCPIWSSPAEDNANFTLLLSEMREILDKEFGVGEKLITACASSSTGWTLPCQDWVSFAPYLDYINIMTYDLAGKWAGVTGHQTPENLTKSAMAYFFNKKIDKSKLNIGSPMYPLWLKVAGDEMPKYVVNAPIDLDATMTDPISDTTHTQQFEKESVTGYNYYVENNVCVMGETFDNSENGTVTGWNFGFDKQAGATYLYNNNPESPYYMWFGTYENPLSLQKKIDLINHYDLAGIIVWESTQDTKDHLMIKRMGEGLNGK